MHSAGRCACQDWPIEFCVCQEGKQNSNRVRYLYFVIESWILEERDVQETVFLWKSPAKTLSVFAAFFVLYWKKGVDAKFPFDRSISSFSSSCLVFQRHIQDATMLLQTPNFLPRVLDLCYLGFWSSRNQAEEDGGFYRPRNFGMLQYKA